MQQEKLIEVNDLKMYFTTGRGLFGKKAKTVRAVDDVSFFVRRGETLGLVGESGCGKTSTGRCLVRLYRPTAGQILYEGEDIANLSGQALMPYRKKIQMIFQDPYASLNPRMTVLDLIGEPLDIHKLASGKERQERVHQLLEMVGLDKGHADRYPHEFSGGQRQRICIAKALAVSPQFIICDEPISALDVSIQAQVVNMLEDLQENLGLTYLFIAHDLSMVKHISNRVGVMYLGKLVELAGSDELYQNPCHPYTQALMSSIPVPDPDAQVEGTALQGDVPSPVNVPSGCRFRTRCSRAEARCAEEIPELKDVGGGHYVACHLCG